MLPWIICFRAKNGAGKSTQSRLLREKLAVAYPGRAVIWRETSSIIRDAFPAASGREEDVLPDGTVVDLREEERKFFAAEPNTPQWVAHLVCVAAEEIIRASGFAIFSGSPRTVFEAERFGAMLRKLASEQRLGGCAIVHLHVPTAIARQRIAAALRNGGVEQNVLAFKLEQFEKRLAWYYRETVHGFALLEEIDDVRLETIRIVDDGRRTPQAISDEIFRRFLEVSGGTR